LWFVITSMILHKRNVAFCLQSRWSILSSAILGAAQSEWRLVLCD
jgi:hypothetical protein